MSEAGIEASDDVTKAIQAAKIFLLRAFNGENVENLGLEEVKHSHGSIWEVTLGFNRTWDHPRAPGAFLQVAAAAARPQRTYKVVRVDLSGPTGVSIANHRGD